MKDKLILSPAFGVFVFLLFLAFSCNFVESQSYPEYGKDLPESAEYRLLQLKGPVKSMATSVVNEADSLISTSSFRFNESGQTLEHNFEINRNLVSVSHQYKYGAAGERINFKRIENGKTVDDDKYIDSLDSEGKVVKRVSYNIDNQLTTKTYFHYSPSGKLLRRESVFFQDGEMVTDSFFYNQQDLLIKESFIRLNKDSIQGRQRTVLYNTRGQITSDIYYFGADQFDLKETFHYDSLGHLIRHKHLMSDSIFYKEALISYNSEGVKTDSSHCFYWSPDLETEAVGPYDTEIYSFRKDGKIDRRIIKKKEETLNTASYTYDKNGNLTAENILHTEGSIKKIFDQVGNEILAHFFDQNNKLIREVKTEIKYDAHQNIIEVKRFKDKKLELHVKKRIEYYK